MKAWRTIGVAIGCAVVISGASGAMAKDPAPKPSAIRPLLDCRKVADGPARLACFDKESAALDEATQNNQIAVMDKEDVRKTKRSLFGLALPALPFFGGGDQEAKKGEEGKDDKDEGDLAQIEAKIASARAIQDGEWVITLDDGARWQTTQAMTYGRPARDLPIVIKKAAFGSYIARINNWPAVKMKRIN